MPGLPSTTSEIESPTGCTKQLISVACRLTPAAELMRPAGMKPSSCASQEAPLPVGALVLGLDLGEGARHAAAHLGDAALRSPLAYFSSSVSRQISCSATGLGN